MAVVEFKNERDVLEYHVNDISSYDGFDNLVEFFISIELGKLLDEKKGPGTRLALIEVGSVKIQLVFSDKIGNYFYATDHAGCKKVKELAKAIENRIADNN